MHYEVLLVCCFITNFNLFVLAVAEIYMWNSLPAETTDFPD